MSVDANIGTIAASVRLDLGGLIGDKAKAEELLKNMSGNITQNINQSVRNLTSNLQAQAAQHAAALNKIATSMSLIGGGIVGALGGAVKVGANFEAMLNHIANNTSMTKDDIGAMTDAVKRLGAESGAPLDKLAEGFMHITNFGFNAADSTKLLDAAMKSAVATGGDVGKTGEILSNVMHEFGIGAEYAKQTMNLLHVEANKGNMTLDQFTAAAGPAFAMAANLGVSVNQAAAAMAALTEHGFHASDAATQVKNMLSHIISPAKGVRDELAHISKITGIDLVHDFSLAGLSTKQLSGVLEDIRTAAGKAGMSISGLVKDLIPAMRGGIGAMVLTGTGLQDFIDRLKDAADAMSGKLDPTTKQYKATLGTLDQQVKIVKANFILMADDIEKALLPAVNGMVASVGNALKQFQSLSPELKADYVTIGAVTGTVLLVSAALIKFAEAAKVVRGVLGLLMVAELGPVLLAAGAVAVVIGIAKVAFDHLNPSIEETNKQEAKLAQTNADAAQTKADNAQKAKELTAQYIKLAGQTTNVKDAHEKMKEILDQIAGLDPTLVTGFNSEGKAIGLVKDAVMKAADAYRVMGKQALIALAAVQALKVQQGAQKMSDLRDDMDKQKNILKSGRAPLSRMEQMDDNINFEDRSGETKAASGADQIAALNQLNADKQQYKQREVAAKQFKDTMGKILDQDKINSLFPYYDNATFMDRFKESPAKPDFSGKGSGKEDKAGHKKHDKAVQDAKDEAERIKQINVDQYNKLFDLQHTDTQNKMREYAQERAETKKLGGDQLLADKLYYAKVAKLREDDAAKQKELSDAQAADFLKISQDYTKSTEDQLAADKTLYIQKAMNRLSEGLRAQNFLNEADDHDREANAKKIENHNIFGQYIEKFFVGQHQAEVDQTALSVAEMDKRNQFDFENNNLSFQQYYDYLQKRLNETKAYTTEWFNLIKEGQAAVRQHEEYNSRQGLLHAPMQALANGMTGIFEKSLNNLFQHGFKNFFKSVLDGFAQMVEQMIVKWLTFEAITGIFGPKVFGATAGGGGKGFFSVFGFDDGENDRKAGRWGFDFANSFRGGISSNMNQRSFVPAGASAGGGMQNTVHVNIDNVHVHDDRDIRQLSESVGWHITQQLRAKVGKQ